MLKIKELAIIAKISTRTLRYYDEIDLLHPHYIDENGYRYYTDKEVDTLQNIMFYRELGYSLTNIKEIIFSNNYDIVSSLKQHYEELKVKKKRVDALMELVEKTIKYNERNIQMKNEEKFEAFKEAQINNNMKEHKDELYASYGKETVDAANTHYKKKSKYEIKEQESLNLELNNQIKLAMDFDINSKEAIKMCELHQKWIQFYWPIYNKEAHLELCKMYTEDPRFTSYYENIRTGAAQFLYEAMKNYLK